MENRGLVTQVSARWHGRRNRNEQANKAFVAVRLAELSFSNDICPDLNPVLKGL